jgi:aspartate/methionine/tyrosine aminotransferase
VERFTESVIREMTRLAQIYEAVNLAQGMPDFPAPGSSFFHESQKGARYVRFCFCKQDTTLQAAKERLQRIRGR